MYLWSPYTIILFIYHEMHLDSQKLFAKALKKKTEFSTTVYQVRAILHVKN